MTEKILFQQGKTEYTILIPAKADKFDHLAANELQRIAYMCVRNRNLRIVNDDNYVEGKKYISIGDTCLFKSSNIDMSKIDFNYDGFLLKTVGDNILINAKIDHAKVYGALEFCERVFDYQRYAVDEEKIVEKKDFSMPNFNLIEKPTFIGRTTFTVLADERDVSLLRANLRSNNFGFNPAFLYQGESLWSTLHDQSTTFQILEFEKYYDAHPEWFTIAEGHTKEEYDGYKDNFVDDYQGKRWTFLKENTQLCYTNLLNSRGVKGGSYETFFNNLINDYISKESDKMFFMIGICDNNHMCNCPDCKRDIEKYTYTGVVLRFINALARDVEAWRKANAKDRKIYLVLFAYLTTEVAPVIEKNGEYFPTDPSVVPEDNVIIRWAPIHANYYHNLLDPLNETKGNPKPRGVLLSWKSITKNFAIWDYRMFFGSHICPYPVWNSLKENLLIYKDINVIDIFAQGPSAVSNHPLYALDEYCRAKLTWNVNLSYKKLFNDFIDNYYKQAGPYIKKYIQELMKHYKGLIDDGASLHVSNNAILKEYWPKEVLIKLEKILDKAYDSIELASQNELVYEKLKNRIDTEAQFPKFALIELYGDTFSKPKLKARIQEFSRMTKITKNKKPIWTLIDGWKTKYLK